jgi:transcription elongation factor Elf1
METKCPHCGSKDFIGTKRTRSGVKLVVIYCGGCGAILGVVNDT